MNILLIGSGAREHAIAKAIKKSDKETNLFCFGSSLNPGIKSLSAGYTVESLTDVAAIVAFAGLHQIDWAFVGPEAPLEAGVVDALTVVGVSAIGPTKDLARIESSKAFTRNLMTNFSIPGAPRFREFSSLDGLENYLKVLEEDTGYVIKADGLMGGKGVKLSGEHLANIDEGIKWAEEILEKGMKFVVEEKLIGQEFSLMSFSDGINLAHMPAAQDHKRAYAGDTGPNTGGMGAYTGADGSLPFLTAADIDHARAINEATIKVLEKNTGQMYKGILYGGFIATADGVKLIEYNARFGDPECETVLPLLESDFVEVCLAIINGGLKQDLVRFAHRAAVCKWVVPEGYPENSIKNEKIDLSKVQDKDLLYYGSVDERDDGLYLVGSRAIAVTAIAGSIKEAEQIAEAEVSRIQGQVFHRQDIGTEELIRERIAMMSELRR